jgi:class 3 adenylate cyclase
MLLDVTLAKVSTQVDDQADLGIQITRVNDVPETGPVQKGVWNQILNVSAVFADLKNSTGLSASARPEESARVYTYFVRAMAVILDSFDAKYVDIQGDGVFGLFSGEQSIFSAVASAITIKIAIEKDLAKRIEKENSDEWEFAAGIGVHRGTLLVRKLGLRGVKQNEVWAGRPVNMAAKLSSLAEPNQVNVSETVFKMLQKSSGDRHRAIFWSCGCVGDQPGGGLDLPELATNPLWTDELVLGQASLDFETMHKLNSSWCKIHGPEFCETIVTGRRP